MTALAALLAALLAAVPAGRSSDARAAGPADPAPARASGAQDRPAARGEDAEAEILENLELLERLEMLDHREALAPPPDEKAPAGETPAKGEGGGGEPGR